MNDLRLRILIFLVFCFLALTSSSQVKKEVHSFTAKYSQGSFLKQDIPLYSNASPFTLGVGYNLRIRNNDSWRKSYNFPTFKIAYSYINLGTRTLGSIHSLYLGYNFNLYTFKKLDLNFGVYTGINYIANNYDTIDVFKKNIRASTKTSAFGLVELSLKWRLNESFHPYIGYSLSHASNGNTKVPNLGYNVLSWGVGVDIILKKPIPRRFFRKGLDSLFTKLKWEIDVSSVAFHKAASFYGVSSNNKEDINYFTSDVDISIRRKIINELWTGFSATTSYDASKAALANSPFFKYPEWSFILSLLVEARLNSKFSSYITVGGLIRNHELQGSSLITKFGFRYFLVNGLYLKAGIKSSVFNAVNWELGVGYRLFSK